MTSPNGTTDAARLAELRGAYRTGHALPQGFYRDPAVHRRDLERLWFREWLLAGHVSELAEAGAYLLYELADESVIVVRGADDVVRAFANVCRHRGARLCAEARGTARRFVCPYHAWTYGLDGRLVAARLMDQTLDPEEWALRPVRCAVYEGFIFLSFSDDAPSFEGLTETLSPHLAAFDLPGLKVAHRYAHPVRANWKLLIENYFECYHCGPAHPEYAQSHVLHLPNSDTTAEQLSLPERSAAAGVSTAAIEQTGASAGDQLAHYYRRYALMTGYQTGSEDGAPLAPLLGRVRVYDGGASDLMLGVMNSFLIYCDHMVAYRFIPTGPETSLAEIIWFVRADAEPGRDYDVEKLAWLWTVTTDADIRIVEANQSGVNSRYYQPGPYAPMEAYSAAFTEHYLATIA